MGSVSRGKLETRCPNSGCGIRLVGSATQIGRHVKCPSCNTPFVFHPVSAPPTGYVIYDLETTGLRSRSDEIIQIAAVRFEAGRVVSRDAFSTYVDPGRSIPYHIQALTGVSDRDVIGAPCPDVALKRFSKFVGDCALIAHNGMRFDRHFLAATCQRYGIDSREVESIDSMEFSRMLFGRGRGIGHGLDVILDRLHLSDPGVRRHDARGDVMLLGRAVEQMWRKLELDAACSAVRKHQAVLPRLQ